MITLNYYFEETELIAGKPIQNSSHNVPQGDYIIIEFRTFHAFIILVYEQTASLQCLRKRILILFELTLCCLLYPHSGVGYVEWRLIILFIAKIFFLHIATAPSGPEPPHFRGFTITPRHTTMGRTSLDE